MQNKENVENSSQYIQGVVNLSDANSVSDAPRMRPEGLSYDAITEYRLPSPAPDEVINMDNNRKA